MHNKAVETDAQRRPRVARAPFIGRAHIYVMSHEDRRACLRSCCCANSGHAFIGLLLHRRRLAKLSSEATLSANRSEQLAKDTETGKIKPDAAGLPAYLRMQAAGERALARMFANHNEAVFSLLLGSLGASAVQAALLSWLFSRRRRSAREMQP
jgi:hypothetical protein